MIGIELWLLGASVLFLLSVFASKASERLGIPALLVFLAIGMLAGSDGPGGLEFDYPRAVQSLGVSALALILFAGGLDTSLEAVRPVLWRGISLATLGVAITAGLVGWVATMALGFRTIEGLLLGAVISSTDAATVFSVLRSRNVSLKRRLQPLLELESGSNDPMAVFLTLAFVRLLTESGFSVLSLVPMFFQQMIVGAIIGYVFGRGAVALINRVALEYEGLYPVLTLSLAILTYSMTASLGGNGFLAVYLAGIMIGNRDFIHKRTLVRFHDGLAWIMQIIMFLTLGLQVFPHRLLPVLGQGLLLSGFLILVARPVSVFVSLLVARATLRDKLMISWVGLRGAAPIILATFPLVAGLPQADQIFHLVFFIVLSSVLVQGPLIPQMARWLKAHSPLVRARPSPLEFGPGIRSQSDLVELTVAAGSGLAGKRIVEVGFPKSGLVVLISRGDDFLVPKGETVLASGDKLLVLADKKDLQQMRAFVEGEKGAAEPSE